MQVTSQLYIGFHCERLGVTSQLYIGYLCQRLGEAIHSYIYKPLVSYILDFTVKDQEKQFPVTYASNQLAIYWILLSKTWRSNSQLHMQATRQLYIGFHCQSQEKQFPVTYASNQLAIYWISLSKTRRSNSQLHMPVTSQLYIGFHCERLGEAIPSYICKKLDRYILDFTVKDWEKQFPVTYASNQLAIYWISLSNTRRSNSQLHMQATSQLYIGFHCERLGETIPNYICK